MTVLPSALRELAAFYAPYGWFVAVWTIPLAVLCVVGTVVPWPASPHAGRLGDEPTHPPTGFLSRIAAVALAVFVGLYVLLVFYHEDLVGLDYAQLTARRFVSVPIWPANGRFFPLGLQEYNLLGLIGRSAVVYHAFSIIELLVVLGCVIRILRAVPLWFRCVVILFMLTLPSVVYSFFGLVYPERDMLLWLAIWVVCLGSFYRAGSRAAFCGALIAGQCVLYYKETAFVLVAGFAAVRLMADGYRIWHEKRRPTSRSEPPGRSPRGWWVQFATDHRLEVAQLALSALFLVVYYVAVARHVTASYVAVRPPGAFVAALRRYAQDDWLIVALMLAVGWRLLARVVAKREIDSFWDSLGVAAVAYALAYVKLGLVREYYLAPADFIGVLFLGHLAWRVLPRRRPALAIAAALVSAWILQRNASDSAYGVVARKQYVEANARVASFLESESRSAHGDSARLRPDGANAVMFFPQAGGFQLMEFSAYLRFKGLQPVGLGAPDSQSAPTFVVESPHRYPDDRCHPSQEFRCRFAATPASGDLVVLLPGREASASELATLATPGREVFRWRPSPTPVERALGAMAGRDRVAAMPSDAYVFRYSLDNDSRNR